MNSIKKLYEKLWKSLIRPQNFPYFKDDLGDQFLIFEETCSIRMDFCLQNPLNEKFNISVYFPCTEYQSIMMNCPMMIYAHTHNGNRLEGLNLVEHFIKKKIGFVAIDFRANGYSTGKFVTLGWYESLDLNTVVNFLKQNVKTKIIGIWGRSMGASATILFLSQEFRQHLQKQLKDKKINWCDLKDVNLIVLDSYFYELKQSLKNLINNKKKQIPNFMINFALKILESEIQNQTGVSISNIKPVYYAKDIRVPTFAMKGNMDEFISTTEFMEVFQRIPSKIKKFQIFQSNHSERRTQQQLQQAFNFIEQIFSFGLQYLQKQQSLDQVSYLNYDESILKSNISNRDLKYVSLVKQKIIQQQNDDIIKNDFEIEFTLKGDHQQEFNISQEEEQFQQIFEEYQDDLLKEIIEEQGLETNSKKLKQSEMILEQYDQDQDLQLNQTYLRGISFSVQPTSLQRNSLTKNLRMSNVENIQRSPLDFKFQLPNSIIKEEPTEENIVVDDQQKRSIKEFLFPIQEINQPIDKSYKKFDSLHYKNVQQKQTNLNRSKSNPKYNQFQTYLNYQDQIQLLTFRIFNKTFLTMYTFQNYIF